MNRASFGGVLTAGLACLLFGSLAANAGPRPGPVVVNLKNKKQLRRLADSKEGRIEIATAYMNARLARSDGAPELLEKQGIRVSVKPTLRDFGGSQRIPIVRLGPVAVLVTQEATEKYSRLPWVRGWRNNGKYGRRLFLIDVNSEGEPDMLEQEDRTRRGRVISAIRGAVTFFSPEVLREAGWPELRELGGKGALVGVADWHLDKGAAVIATGVGLHLIAQTLSRIETRVHDERVKQEAAHNIAIAQTADWGNRMLTDEKREPSLHEAFNMYKVQLKGNRMGTPPLKVEEFANRLVGALIDVLPKSLTESSITR